MNSFLLGSLFILGGCVANVFFLELLVRYTENSMVLLSFSQFLTTSLWNISEFWQWSGTFPFIGLKERVIPIKNYVFLTVVFFSLSVMNNKALEYDISIPVHTVFRSCSLPVTLIVGTLVFKKSYSKAQIYTCLLITVGIIIATLADAEMRMENKRLAACCSDAPLPPPSSTPLPSYTASNSGNGDCGEQSSAKADLAAMAAAASAWLLPRCASLISIASSPLVTLSALSAALSSVFASACYYLATGEGMNKVLLQLSAFYDEAENQWLIGIFMLSLCLFVAAFIGHFQEHTYSVYGRAWKENMFYSHLLPLPLFITHLPSFYRMLRYDWAALPLVSITLGAYPVEVSMYTVLVLNNITQMICIRGVYIIIGNYGSVTNTVLITVRKFISLLLSIVYFQSQFTDKHWIGTACVFAGIVGYVKSAKMPSTAASVQASAGDAGDKDAGDAVVDDGEEENGEPEEADDLAVISDDDRLDTEEKNANIEEGEEEENDEQVAHRSLRKRGTKKTLPATPHR